MSLQNKEVIHVQVTGIWKTWKGFFGKDQNKNVDITVIGNVNDYISQWGFVNIYGYYDGKAADKDAFYATAFIPLIESSHDVYAYFRGNNVDISYENCVELYRLKGENIITWCMRYPENIKKLIIDEKTIKNLENYFFKYNISTLLETTYPDLQKKICGGRPLSVCIADEYGEKAVDLIKNDPYIFALDNEFRSYTFNLAEKIAYRMRKSCKDEIRVKAILIKSFKEILDYDYSGSTYINMSIKENYEKWMRKAKELSGKVFKEWSLDYTLLSYYIQDAINDIDFLGYEVINNQNCIYFKDLYEAEKLTNAWVKSQLKLRHIINMSNKDIMEGIESFESLQSKTLCSQFKFTSEQKSAIKMALTNNLSIITGGPGCGKTKVIQAILYILQKYRKIMKIATAFTGKATKKLRENIREIPLISCDISTMTKIALSGELMTKRFIVIDEFSMVEQKLFARFLRNIDNCQVLIVGDNDQLPSIGAGQVLKDFIDCNKIPIRSLTINKRLQNLDAYERKGILWNYQSILNNDYNSIQQLSNKFEWQSANIDDDKALSLLCDYYCNYIHGSNGFPKIDIQDICVLMPMKTLEKYLSVRTVNKELRERLNPDGEDTGYYYKGYTDKNKNGFPIKIGDRVLITKNFSSKNCCNGDIGFVDDCVYGKINVILDNGDNVQLEYDETDYLDLAYAMTIHKSQGSEYKIVLLAFTRELNSWFFDTGFLSKNLVYTAVTRAKETLFLFGYENTMQKAIETNMLQRNTLLSYMLKN